ncbi:MAG: universal stress protein [Porphyrobacter sp.]|nr:universal stress protein [Porphyrobacter sp.]
MRSILLHARRDDRFESRFQAALDVARQLDAHLTCLQATSFDVAVPGDLYGTVISEMIPVIRDAALEFRAEIEARLAKEDVRWSWAEEYGTEESYLLDYAALSDLVVVSAAPSELGARGPSPLVGGLAIHGRAPLLVVPNDQSGLSLGGAALVAWNNSAEASRALKAAVPFLARASSVSLAIVAEEKPDSEHDIPPLRGVEYLARHGIEAEVVELRQNSDGVAATLEQEAKARGATYLVMGAYGHSRLRQLLFGGVTRRLLTDPGLPLLLAH